MFFPREAQTAVRQRSERTNSRAGGINSRCAATKGRLQGKRPTPAALIERVPQYDSLSTIRAR